MDTVHAGRVQHRNRHAPSPRIMPVRLMSDFELSVVHAFQRCRPILLAFLPSLCCKAAPF